MAKTNLITAAILAAAITPVQAGMDGNSLKGYCAGDDPSYCLGFVTGVALELNLGASLSDAPRIICPESGVTYGQMVDVVKKHLDDNPADLHRYAHVLATVALINAFPCEVKK